MVRIDAVIFDHDGTLVDSETITLSLLAEMAVEHGAEVFEDDADRFVGADLRVVLAEIEHRSGTPLPHDFLHVFRVRQEERIRSGLQEVPGADDVLTALTLPTAVASNAPVAKMQLCLGATGLDRHFAAHEMLSAYDVGEWKPAPGVFLAAAEVLDTSPQRCAVVEDSEPGIHAGLAAGMTVFAYDPDDKFESIAGITRLGSLVDLLEYL